MLNAILVYVALDFILSAAVVAVAWKKRDLIRYRLATWLGVPESQPSAIDEPSDEDEFEGRNPVYCEDCQAYHSFDHS